CFLVRWWISSRSPVSGAHAARRSRSGFNSSPDSSTARWLFIRAWAGIVVLPARSPGLGTLDVAAALRVRRAAAGETVDQDPSAPARPGGHCPLSHPRLVPPAGP